MLSFCKFEGREIHSVELKANAFIATSQRKKEMQENSQKWSDSCGAELTFLLVHSY